MGNAMRSGGRGVATVAAAGALAAWFWATVASSHPSDMFGRVRRRDRLGLALPNWRFFAPYPARVDYALIYRVEEPDGTPSPWRYAMEPILRTWTHTVWFPGRRRSKALFDVVAELLTVAQRLTPRGGMTGEVLDAYPSYAALRDFTESVVRRRHAGGELPAGFQFAAIEHCGYDEHEQPEPVYLMVSSFVPLDPAPAVASAA